MTLSTAVSTRPVVQPAAGRAASVWGAFGFGVVALMTGMLRAEQLPAQPTPPRVVHETLAAWKSAHMLKLTIEQTWCGDADVPGCDFAGISGAVALPNGGIVANAIMGPINEFASNGTFVRTLGHKGQGAGEYGAIWGLNRLSDGTLVWFDNMQLRTTKLAASGKPGAVQKLIPPMNSPAIWMMRDTLIVFETPANANGDTVTATYRTVTASGVSRVLARVRTTSLFRPGAFGFMPPAPFAPRVVSYVGTGGDVVHSNGGRYLFEVFPSNGAHWELAVDIPMVPVTDAEHDSVVKSALKSFRVANVASLPPAVRAKYETRIANHAPLQSVFVTPDGMIWIRPVAESGAKRARWDVFTRDGKRVGAAMLPLTGEVLDGMRDWILVRELNSDDVPLVVRYRVTN